MHLAGPVSWPTRVQGAEKGVSTPSCSPDLHRHVPMACRLSYSSYSSCCCRLPLARTSSRRTPAAVVVIRLVERRSAEAVPLVRAAALPAVPARRLWVLVAAPKHGQVLLVVHLLVRGAPAA